MKLQYGSIHDKINKNLVEEIKGIKKKNVAWYYDFCTGIN